MTFGRTRLALSTVALCVLCIGAALAQTPPPQLGTWKLNVAKSKFNPGPATKSSTVTISTAGQGAKTVVDSVGPDGSKIHWEYTTNLDGKPTPVTGNGDGDMASAKRIDANTVEIAYTLKGKPTTRVRRTVSADGTVMTVTQTGTTAQGRKIDNVLVFEK